MMINLEWLRTYKEVYERGSMTAAAEALMISQPGVSLHLSSLENHVGYKLFERRPRLLIPTERGKQLYNSIADPLSCLEEVEVKSQKSPQAERITVTLGMCFETFQLALEPEVPKLPFNLILEFAEYRRLLEKLENQVSDLVVSPHKPELRGISYLPFSQETIVIYAGKGTDLTGFQTDDLDQLENWLDQQTWYGIASDNDHMQRFWKANFNQKTSFRPNYIVPNFHSIFRILAGSPGLAIVPDFLVPQLQAQPDGSAADHNDGKTSSQLASAQIIWAGSQPLQNVLYFAYHKKSPKLETIKHIMGVISQRMPARPPS